MGLQTDLERLMTWSETEELGKRIKHCAIQQFLRVYHKMMLRQPDTLKYGDEIESLLVEYDERNKTVRLLLQGEQLCEKLKNQQTTRTDMTGLWTLEYGRFMIESTPKEPYEGLENLGLVEKNIKDRRLEALTSLAANQKIVTVSSFPRLGCEDSLVDSQYLTCNGPLMNSRFLPDAIVVSKLRTRGITKNTISRRGRKISINIPIFQDQCTSRTFIETYSDPVDAAASEKGCVYMDSMAFGNGCCSLQVTLQAEDLEQLKVLYDQFGAVSPILKALSASSPIFRGYLVDVDSRWPVLVQAIDDRTVAENADNSPEKRVTPRYSSIRSYISADGLRYNDVPFVVDREAKKVLMEEGVDEGFASHLANTFSRDPMYMSEEKLQMDNEHDTFHFESVQSLNYQSVRFKLPPPNTDMGWRLELRVCDVQLTDFENAAFVTFVVLLSRVILEKGLDFLMPISKVDENMLEADKNDSERRGKFWCNVDCKQHRGTEKPFKIAEKMSMDAIINGREGKTCGLVPKIRSFLETIDISAGTKLQIERHITLISKRASGDYLTTAQWIRNFVRSHRDYNKDSIVPGSTAYDLLVAFDNVECGVIEDPRILKGKRRNHSENLG